MDNQLIILSESLDKKIEILKEIQHYNEKQEKCFKDGQAKLEDFDEAVAHKEKLIEKVQRLDLGFEALYQRVAEELKDNRQMYSLQIKEMQEKIAIVTELNVSIQAQEQRNKKLVEEFFAAERMKLKTPRKVSKSAYDRYKEMNGMGRKTTGAVDNRK